VLPVARVLVDSGTINAAASAKVCDKGKTNLSVTVQTVLCRPSVIDCLAVVDFPSDKLLEMSKTFGDTSPRLQASTNSC